MSKHVNPDALSEDDILYIRDRPYLRREFILQGHGDPLDPDYPGRISNQEVDLTGESRNEATAESGTIPTSTTEDTSSSDDETFDGKIVLTDEMQWNSSTGKADLEKVIEARNAVRDPNGDWYIKPDGDNKADLQEALKADDARVEAFNAE